MEGGSKANASAKKISKVRQVANAFKEGREDEKRREEGYYCENSGDFSHRGKKKQRGKEKPAKPNPNLQTVQPPPQDPASWYGNSQATSSSFQGTTTSNAAYYNQPPVNNSYTSPQAYGYAGGPYPPQQYTYSPPQSANPPQHQYHQGFSPPPTSTYSSPPPASSQAFHQGSPPYQQPYPQNQHGSYPGRPPLNSQYSAPSGTYQTPMQDPRYPRQDYQAYPESSTRGLAINMDDSGQSGNTTYPPASHTGFEAYDDPLRAPCHHGHGATYKNCPHCGYARRKLHSDP